MKSISKPVKSVVDVLEILKTEASRQNSIDIESVKNILKEREDLYKTKVNNNTLFEIQRDKTISARVGKDEMIRYYEYRLKDKPKGREIYDEIYLSAPYNICPYCTVGIVKSVDHFLPKSEYPSYSITPINLVPCCRDCNTDKKISYPTNSDNQPFHPYFDKVDNICWIKAELMQSEPICFKYIVIKPVDWDEKQNKRACTHFESYNINQIFSNEANRELRSMQSNFKRLRADDISQLKLHLEQTYQSCLKGLGILDWKTLMYKELSTNEWFLNGCLGVNFFN
jgi:5-methylcytosine-specific restriction endonuclease McrA